MIESFTTPRGRTVQMEVRPDTVDHNNLWSCLNEDEYGLKGLELTGLALDIGAHIGGATVALLADNPGLEVIAVEAVPPNAELLRRNLELNNLTARVVEGAACGPKQKRQKVAYGYRGSELATQHAWIGNATIVDKATDHDVVSAVCHSLTQLAPDGCAFIKIDCEGCEWDFLSGPSLAQVERIHGEWHPTDGHVYEDLLDRFLDTHDINFTGPAAGPGGFTAVRR